MTEEERLELQANAMQDQVMSALESKYDIINRIASDVNGTYSDSDVLVIRMMSHAVLGMIHMQRAQR